MQLARKQSQMGPLPALLPNHNNKNNNNKKCNKSKNSSRANLELHKFKVEEVPIVSLFTRDSSRSASQRT
jgi:hypothetical protein